MAANTIQQLTTANTFQHWLTATQSLIGVANNLTNGAGDTFYANTRLEIGGTGASLNVVTGATINELTVTDLNVTSGFALSGNLSAINVTNDAFIGSDLFVYANTDIDGTLNVTGDTTIVDGESTGTLTYNVATGSTLTVTGETNLDNVTFTGFISGNGSSLTDVTVANTNITGTIVTAQIADAAVTADKIAAGLTLPSPVGNGTYYLTSDNSNSIWQAQSALSIATTQLTGTITNSQINDVANTKITGVIDASQGGTGQSSLTANSVVIGNGSDAVQFVAPGTSGNVLTSDGTNWLSQEIDSTSVVGTANQVLANGTSGTAQTGEVTLTTPQDIATSSDVQFNSFGVGTAGSGTTGEIRATNNITAYYSDKRLKNIKGNIDNALDKVMSLNGVYYENNEVAEKYGYINKEQQVGVLAQEVEQVLPEIVKPAPFDIGQNEDGTEYSLSGNFYKTVQYEKLVPLLLEAIKELKQEVDSLKENR